MARYSWRNLSFDAPTARDDSTILLIDPAEPPTYNLTVRVDPLPGGASTFGAYVTSQRPASGAVIDKKSDRSIAGRAAVVFESHLRADTEVLRQHQALISDGDDVVVLTMTARPSAAALARAAFDKALASMTWR